MSARTKNNLKKLTSIERTALRATRWVGSGQSLVVHTILFTVAFLLALFGVPIDRVLLVLTTIVSLEAIYLSIFIQISVNQQSRRLREVSRDVEEIQEDIEEIQEDVEGIEKDIDEIQEDVEEISEDVEGIEKDIEEIQEDVEEISEDTEQKVPQPQKNKTTEKIKEAVKKIVKK